MGETSRSPTISTQLQRIAEQAKQYPEMVFTTLAHLMDVDFLREAYQRTRKDSAPGIDGVTAQDYAEHLDENLRDLHERLRGGRYQAPPVKRHWLAKADGSQRPIGLPTFEDKIVQRAVTMVLGAIYEEDFHEFSHGFRPGHSAHQALSALREQCREQRINWIVDADVSGFFDHLDHQWMIRMVEERVEDRAFLGLIRKWLRAGILDTTGAIIHPVTGTPQGGVVSPVLSNVYLHYVLDLWFEKVIKPQCRGEACLLRYADDYICAFEYAEEAERFYTALGPRLEKFGLTLAAEKTRILPFSRQQPPGQSSFEFLGFEFRWGWDRAGKAHLKRRTARAKLRASLQRFTQWCRENRQRRLPVLFKQLNSKLRGYYQYYGVHGNSASLKQFFEGALRILWKWLNRRSQRPSYTWQGFQAILAHFKVERPRIVRHAKRRKATALA